MSSPQLYLRNLIRHQRINIGDVGLYGKLRFEDLKRIDLYTPGDMIVSKECVEYMGEITKSGYMNISYKGKKVSLLRLLYHNYIDEIEPKYTMVQTCGNKKCVNINHLKSPENKEEKELEVTPVVEEPCPFTGGNEIFDLCL